MNILQQIKHAVPSDPDLECRFRKFLDYLARSHIDEYKGQPELWYPLENGYGFGYMACCQPSYKVWLRNRRKDVDEQVEFHTAMAAITLMAVNRLSWSQSIKYAELLLELYRSMMEQIKNDAHLDAGAIDRFLD